MCSDKRNYDNCKSNAPYDQWYKSWEKRWQKYRRNKDTDEISPSILYVILPTYPQDELKSHRDLCKEGWSASLRKQKGL